MKPLQRFLPLIVILGLLTLFFVMLLGDRDPREIKSVLIDKPAPAFTLAALNGSGAVTEKALNTGKPVIVNFFASWCVPCRAEHPSLMRLANDYNIPIIGISYKDTPDKTEAFLDELGTPYSQVLLDPDGRNAINWGVTGVPETFLIDGDGIIRYRHWGPVVEDGLEKRLLPHIKALEK